MLNRRVFRIKVMQALYSYYLNKESLREVSLQNLLSKYELDPAVHDFADKDLFVAKQQLIEKSFYEKLKAGETNVTDNVTLDDIKEINFAVSSFYDAINAERKLIAKRMSVSARGIFQQYIKLLLIPGELAFLERQDQEKDEKAYLRKEGRWLFHLINNAWIEKLESVKSLVDFSIENKLSWKGEIDTLRTWYRDILKKDQVFIDFHQKDSVTDAETQELMTYLFKKVIFGNEVIENYWIHQDIQWDEDRQILKSMVLKTLKSYNPEAEENFEIKSLSANEEDDFQYFERLFADTLEKDDFLESTIQKSAKNWDMSRIAAIDMVIMKMALTEMMTCPSIPVKVTINEFIEISKNYSTPKSKQFINGILDVLSNKLTSEGLIRKSGRGLIDNK